MTHISDSSNLHWWQRGVVYQIYPRSFQDTDADGIGDLEGVIRRLDYLNDGTPASLGVDAIWLSPFYPSPMADFGYDIADYCDVHPLFGDLATFDRLVTEAHRRGIRVIIDYVPNHTSDQHSWFQESRSSRDNPRREWYLWRNPAPGGGPPSNWGSSFGGPAWEWDENTGQYYFHHFLKEQPDLNWRNPEVRQAMLGVLRFWLDRGVDGFRIDVVGMILKDPDFRDNPLNSDAPANRHVNDIVSLQHNIYNQDLDEVHEVIREFRQLVDSYDERCLIGEVWSELPRWVRYYGRAGEGLHLPFNFRLIGTRWTAADVRRSIDELEACLPTFAWPNYVLGNHDVARLATRLGADQARLAAMLLLTLRGTPTLYYGDEIGLENGQISPDRIVDPQGIRLGPDRTRDVARTPMQWDTTGQAGFTTGEPWLPLSQDAAVRNVAVQAGDPGSIFSMYLELLRLRRDHQALQTGSYLAFENGGENIFTYLRETPGQRSLVVLNFSSQPQIIALDGLGEKGQILLSTYMDRKGPVHLKQLEIRGNEAVLLLL